MAYGTLAKRDRRRLHLSAARYFETLDDEGIAGALAEHYVAAYRAQPEGPEGEAVAAQARVALRCRRARARSLGSFVQAGRFLERALEVTTDPNEQRQLHAAAADAAQFAGLLEDQLEHSERALELARASDDRLALMRALADRARALSYAGQVVEVIDMLAAARVEFADLAATREHVDLSSELARARSLAANRRRQCGWSTRRCRSPSASSSCARTLMLIITRGPALAGLGRIREAIVTLQGAVTVCSSYGLTEVENARA